MLFIHRFDKFFDLDTSIFWLSIITTKSLIAFILLSLSPLFLACCSYKSMYRLSNQPFLELSSHQPYLFERFEQGGPDVVTIFTSLMVIPSQVCCCFDRNVQCVGSRIKIHSTHGMPQVKIKKGPCWQHYLVSFSSLVSISLQNMVIRDG